MPLCNRDCTRDCGPSENDEDIEFRVRGGDSRCMLEADAPERGGVASAIVQKRATSSDAFIQPDARLIVPKSLYRDQDKQ